MSEIKFNFNNYNLTPLQLENSITNEKEYASAITDLNSYPRRILLTLDSSLDSGEPKELYHPRHLRPLEPAMNYSEELILFSSFPTDFPENIQIILDTANDYKIKKSVITDVSNLGQLSPWVFQYDVSKVHILINPAGDMNSIQNAVRDLVVRKYFANTKPVVNIVYQISDINDSMIMPMLMLPYEAEADSISLIFNDFSDISEKFISQVKEKTEYYGIAMKAPFEDSDYLKYSLWSDLCINYDGRLIDFLNGNNISSNAPEPEASFQKDIWNLPGLIELRTTAGSRDFSQMKGLYNHIL